MSASAAVPAPLLPDDMELHRYGVDLSAIGEEIENRLALGHVEPRRMLAAALAWEREYFDRGAHKDWEMTADDALDAVDHRYAVRVPEEETAGPYGWCVNWDRVTAETPGAFPVTLLEVGDR